MRTLLTGEIYYSGKSSPTLREAILTCESVGSQCCRCIHYILTRVELAKIWNDETAEFFVWYDSDGAAGSNEGYEIAVQYQNGAINSWGIDNRNFDTFQNVQVDQALADAIKLRVWRWVRCGTRKLPRKV